MNLHEYQGKQILSSYGVRVQRGHVANTAEEAVDAAKQLTEETGTGWHVIKAQIHAGGRGKGKWLLVFLRNVRLMRFRFGQNRLLEMGILRKLLLSF